MSQSDFESSTTMKLEGLDNLLKAIDSKDRPFIRLGIMAGQNARTQSIESKDKPTKKGTKTKGQKIPTNAEIGAAHEFGTEKLPQRSFLRMPLSTQLNSEIQKAGLTSRASLKEVVEQKSVTPWLNKIAVLAYGVVMDAFNTGGFGKWKTSNMKRKKVHQTLVETQQLRDSITYEVKNK